MIAALACATGIAPAALLAEDDAMIAAMFAHLADPNGESWDWDALAEAEKAPDAEGPWREGIPA